jgi:hypothetical protein
MKKNTKDEMRRVRERQKAEIVFKENNKNILLDLLYKSITSYQNQNYVLVHIFDTFFVLFNILWK